MSKIFNICLLLLFILFSIDKYILLANGSAVFFGTAFNFELFFYINFILFILSIGFIICLSLRVIDNNSSTIPFYWICLFLFLYSISLYEIPQLAEGVDQLFPIFIIILYLYSIYDSILSNTIYKVVLIFIYLSVCYNRFRNIDIFYDIVYDFTSFTFIGDILKPPITQYLSFIGNLIELSSCLLFLFPKTIGLCLLSLHFGLFFITELKWFQLIFMTLQIPFILENKKHNYFKWLYLICTPLLMSLCIPYFSENIFTIGLYDYSFLSNGFEHGRVIKLHKVELLHNNSNIWTGGMSFIDGHVNGPLTCYFKLKRIISPHSNFQTRHWRLFFAKAFLNEDLLYTYLFNIIDRPNVSLYLTVSLGYWEDRGANFNGIKHHRFKLASIGHSRYDIKYYDNNIHMIMEELGY